MLPAFATAAAPVINGVTSTLEAAAAVQLPHPVASDLPARPQAARADFTPVNAIVPQFAAFDATPLSLLLHGGSDGLQRKFEDLRQQLNDVGDTRRSAVASGVALSGTLSIGYVVWLVRGGVLIGSMLSALPAWQMVDPLAVVSSARKPGRKAGGEADEPEVDRLFDDAPVKPASPAAGAVPATSADGPTAPPGAARPGEGDRPMEMRT